MGNPKKLKTLIIIWSLFVASQHEILPITEVPELHLNFYMMGKSSIDSETADHIVKNIEYLNEEFEGRILFKLGNMVLSSQHAYIPDIHSEYVSNVSSTYVDMVESVEEAGNINVFLFETYSKNDGITAMTGFTPVLSAYHSTYSANSPQFDRLFIAYPGLINKSTLVHEMGHFLGLHHPWDMHSLDKELMGFNEDPTAETNHMTYHHEVDHFTKEQLDRMHHFALQFRSYLIQNVELTY